MQRNISRPVTRVSQGGDSPHPGGWPERRRGTSRLQKEAAVMVRGAFFPCLPLHSPGPPECKRPGYSEKPSLGPFAARRGSGLCPARSPGRPSVFIACPGACFAVIQGLLEGVWSQSVPFTDGFMVSVPFRDYHTPASASACQWQVTPCIAVQRGRRFREGAGEGGRATTCTASRMTGGTECGGACGMGDGGTAGRGEGTTSICSRRSARSQNSSSRPVGRPASSQSW